MTALPGAIREHEVALRSTMAEPTLPSHDKAKLRSMPSEAASNWSSIAQRLDRSLKGRLHFHLAGF